VTYSNDLKYHEKSYEYFEINCLKTKPLISGTILLCVLEKLLTSITMNRRNAQRLLPLMLVAFTSNLVFANSHDLPWHRDTVPVVPAYIKSSIGHPESQDSVFAEQAAFDFFLSIVTKKKKELFHKKYVFDGILNEVHSRFTNSFICFNNEVELYEKIKSSAYRANQDRQESDLRKSVKIGDTQRKYFVKKSNEKVLKMIVFKATKVDSLWYVQLRIEDTEYHEDYFFEIDEQMNVKRWRPVAAIL
jgi:hypothetical protein